VLITSGPTQEPIDAVRYIGNRSSGRLGAALADESARREWTTTILAGSGSKLPESPQVTVHRFRSTADLDALLRRELPHFDILIMAAAVADYRPKSSQTDLLGKMRREPGGLVLELEATPDLLKGCAERRLPGQVLTGFALEPREEMTASARRKLERKGIDLVVANPLETMDAGTIEATVFGRRGTGLEDGEGTPGPIPKEEFAPWLLDLCAGVWCRLGGGDSATNSEAKPAGRTGAHG
jgi:phosphopantothenoylcysteine decarboxylase/phosphopantothenate--cysteine ligase